MSFNGELDEDRENKLKVFDILWNLNYICRLEVALKDYSYKGMEYIKKAKEVLKKEWTDIDVLGWKYKPFLGIRKITTSVKGKAKNVKDKEEIFKLAGINQLIHPAASYYIKDNPSLEELFLFARDLNINIISKSALNDMFNRSLLNIKDENQKNTPILTSKGANIIGKALNKFKTKNQSLYEFITVDVWSSKFPLKYYLAEECLILTTKNFNKDDDNSIILLLYAFSNYLIVISELISKVDCCRLTDLDLFLVKTMELDATGSEIARNVYNAFINGLKNVKIKAQLDAIRSESYSPERFLPEFSRYVNILKESWKKNLALFTSIRILDFLLFHYVETQTFFDVEKLPSKYFFSKSLNTEALYLIRHIITHFANNKKLNSLLLFGKLFNILR